MNCCVLLAKSAVENYIKEGKTIEPSEDLFEDFPKGEASALFNEKAGVFISIFKEEQGKKTLRGCIGTYLPTRPNIAQEIVYNAIAAAKEDFRFGQIEKEELSCLSYLVYILGYPEEIKDLKELDPQKFGIIVKTIPFVYPDQDQKVTFDGYVPFKTGLLLPGLQGIETAEEQFFAACQKGGINPKQEKIFIYKFTVKKFE